MARRILNTSLLRAPPAGRNVVILGAPGSGKGTYSKQISNKFSIPVVGTGDMVRAAVSAGGPLGARLRAANEAGGLAPAEDVLAMVRTRLSEPDCAGGFILDGFPRSVSQAKALMNVAPVHLVIRIEVPDEHVVAKMLGRRHCEACGAGYNIADVQDDVHGVYMPAILPKCAGPHPVSAASCDLVLECDCGAGPLSRRGDDDGDVIAARLAVYHADTAPVIDFYRKQNIVAEYRVQRGLGDMPQLVRELVPWLGSPKA
jgi:adenylate kinase